jgi:hypothetical protein
VTSSHDNLSEPSADGALALVCVLAPLDRAARLGTVRHVLERATGRSEQNDGVLLEFPEADEISRMLLDFVLAERRCCPHFTYELCFAPDQRRVTLRMRASGAYLTPVKALYRELGRDTGGRD